LLNVNLNKNARRPSARPITAEDITGKVARIYVPSCTYLAVPIIDTTKLEDICAAIVCYSLFLNVIRCV
jgi:hypothetical protein